ncbi:hypothetical protein C8R45DRAFT_1222029 [Mycena sanguinolenta]|nr:hypothetical protein C8R45DRAFT_1222029 [Mycena sanguinolenta]
MLTNAQTARCGVGRRTGEACWCETRHGQQSGSVAGPLTSYGSELYQDDGYNRSSSTTLCRCSMRDSLTALEDGSPAPTGAGTDCARRFQGGKSPCFAYSRSLSSATREYLCIDGKVIALCPASTSRLFGTALGTVIPVERLVDFAQSAISFFLFLSFRERGAIGAGADVSFAFIFATPCLGILAKVKLMEADAATTAFVSIISHELRTKLHGLLSQLELICEFASMRKPSDSCKPLRFAG